MPSQAFRSGGIYRYAADKDPHAHLGSEGVDGNFFAITHLKGKSKVLLDRGIWSVAGEDSLPVIMISSAFHNKGSQNNPWRDVFEPDHGFVKYFGDAKESGNPAERFGNKALLREFDFHTSPDERLRKQATPLVIFERVEVGGAKKGFVKFVGLGVIESAELVTQYSPKNGYFTNYIFNFAILSLTNEFEHLDWAWINARREGDVNAHSLAPKSWREWVKTGNSNLSAIRRKVVRHKVFQVEDQVPRVGTKNRTTLDAIYNFYTNESTKHRFELLASRVVMSFFNSRGIQYDLGWVTQGSGDGGVDFVGKIAFGEGISHLDILVLGQAKCEVPTKATSAKDLARTVARLKRGWIGAYVTTSFFSEPSQSEMFEDQYPLLKIPGDVVAIEVQKLMDAAGFSSVSDYLSDLDGQYGDSVSGLKPEDLLDLAIGQRIGYTSSSSEPQD